MLACRPSRMLTNGFYLKREWDNAFWFVMKDGCERGLTLA